MKFFDNKLDPYYVKLIQEIANNKPSITMVGEPLPGWNEKGQYSPETQQFYQNLFTELKANRHVTFLNLQSIKLNLLPTATIELFAEMLRDNKSIKSLNLADTGLEKLAPATLEKLFKALGESPSINWLDLMSNNLSILPAATLANCMQHLAGAKIDKLILHHNGLPDEQAESLKQTLGPNVAVHYKVELAQRTVVPLTPDSCSSSDTSFPRNYR